jgi:hypothetical protein
MLADFVVDGGTRYVRNTCSIIDLKAGVAPMELLLVRDLKKVTATTYFGFSAGAMPMNEIACRPP